METLESCQELVFNEMLRIVVDSDPALSELRAHTHGGEKRKRESEEGGLRAKKRFKSDEEAQEKALSVQRSLSQSIPNPFTQWQSFQRQKWNRCGVSPLLVLEKNIIFVHFEEVGALGSA